VVGGVLYSQPPPLVCGATLAKLGALPFEIEKVFEN